MKRIYSFLLTAALIAGLILYAAPYSAAAAQEDAAALLLETEEEALSEEGSEEAGLPEMTDAAEPSEEGSTVPEEITEDPAADEKEEPAEEETQADAEEEPAAEETQAPAEETEPAAESEEDAEFAVIEEEEFTVEEDPAKTGEDQEEEKIMLSSAAIPHSTLVYNGKERTQTLKSEVKAVVDGEETVLTYKQDYTVTYKNNIEVGTATMIFKGIGKYSGTLKKTFKILPPSTTIKSITPGTKCFLVKWTKKTNHVRGYELQYALKSDFSDRQHLYIKDNTDVSRRIADLISGKKYYIRVRTFLTVDGTNYYSRWSPVETIKLTYNTVKITGSGVKRTVTLMNPKTSVKQAKVAIWSNTNDKDDKKFYTMKKASDGSWKATVYAAYLKHYGECTFKCYSGDTLLDEGTFTFTKEEYNASKNSIFVGGSGYTRTIRLAHPSGIKSLRAAVWSEEGGQDDLKWYTMEKQDDGSWFAQISTMNLTHAGICNVHVYANENTFIGKTTFSCKLYDAAITWNSSWEFASYSKIHTGTAKLYRATKNRKGIVVGINSGHGTILPAGQDNYVYSHPDHTPKVTGGSTAAGAVWTICDNTGMSFNDGTPEAHVTLQQGLILKEVLLNAGYDVIVIRENNDSGLDVIARTVICNNLADCHISLHWDGDGLPYDKGIFYMSVPDALKSMYPTSTIWSESNRLGDSIIQGMRQKGLPIFEGGSMQMDLMQTSYSKVPSIDIELGNQSSSHTDNDLRARANAMLAGLNIFFGQN